MKQRIRHLFPHHGILSADESIPRGWITPKGHFFKTKEHWASINSHFRRPDTRPLSRAEAPEEAEEAEKSAHLAYHLGWVSVGHAGNLNAVAHQKTFLVINHPAILTLRKLLAEVPHLAIPIELQLGAFLPSKGLHEDFEMNEYDLDFLIKRGRLRQFRK